MFPVINDYDLLYWFLAISFVFVCIFLLKHHLCVFKMFNYSLLHTESPKENHKISLIFFQLLLLIQKCIPI